MENVICTIVDCSSPKEFISSLNKYGVCIDYSSDYERSKATQGIFVGVVNKVYEVIPKGEGGHPEHDSLFISAKSLINSSRESQPFRVGFVGQIVHQLVDANLEQGDAIGVLKPTFFYALDIPCLCAQTGSVVVWISKNLKDSQISTLDTAKSTSESQINKHQNERRNGINKTKKRIENEEKSDILSLSESSSSSSGTLQRNVQIYRSKPVELNKLTSSKVLANNKLIPDSTTRSVVQNYQNERLSKKKNGHEIEIAENIVSQNTANDGSADVPVKNNNGFSNFLYNCSSSARCVQNDIWCSHDNYVNNTCCGPNSRVLSCERKCHCSKVSCCNCQTDSENYMFQDCSRKLRTFREWSHSQQCKYSRNSCGQSSRGVYSNVNSAHSCYVSNCSCKRHFDHVCRSMKLCSKAAHPQVNKCFQHCCSSQCQNNCTKSVFPRFIHSDQKSCNLALHCCNKQIIQNHCHNLCCSSHEQTKVTQNKSSSHCSHEQTKVTQNKSSSHCCITKSQFNAQLSKLENLHEAESSASEDSHRNIRTKEWVHKWRQNPPCFELQSEKSLSQFSDISFPNPSSCGDVQCEISRTNKSVAKNKNEKSQETAKPRDRRLLCNLSGIVAKESDKKHIAKKKKLFSPLDNSTIISERSVYNHSTIVEESTPFSSDNVTDNPPLVVLPSGNNQSHSNINISKPSVELPLSNKVMSNKEMNANSSKASVCELDVQTDILENKNKTIEHNETVIVSVHNEMVAVSVHNEPTVAPHHMTAVVHHSVVISPIKVMEELAINENQFCQNKGPGLEENRYSSEEPFPELQIDLPIISPTDNILTIEESQKESSLVQGGNMTRKDSSENEKSHDSVNNIALRDKDLENLGSREMNHIVGALNSSNGGGKTISEEVSSPQGILSEKSLDQRDNFVMVTNLEEESVIRDIDTNVNGKCIAFSGKTARSNSSNISLSLSGHSKSKVVGPDDNENMEMDLTLICDKVQKRMSKENSDDIMELTCESKLMKRRKKDNSKEICEDGRSSGSTKAGVNINSNIRDFSVSSSGTFYDAQSVGTTSQTPDKWCLKRIDEFFGNEDLLFLPKVLKKFGLKNCSYDLNLFSTFDIVGIIINVEPTILPDNYQEIVKGFCNERCRKDYRFEDYFEMEEVGDFCTFCRHRYHLACPGCLKEGLTNPLCLYYSFEIHLFDGKNVFRVEIEHQSGVNFIGCTPQLYLKSNKLFKKIKKIIASPCPTKWIDTVLLKARIKVVPKLGVPVLTLQDTSLRKDLILKGKHYKL